MKRLINDGLLVLLLAAGCWAASAATPAPASLTKLTIEPAQVTLGNADQSVQLLVTAHLSDGTRRDVTRAAAYSVLAAKAPAKGPAEFTVKKGEPLKLNVAVRRDATMPNAVDLSGAGTQLPPGLEIPLIKVAAGKTSAEFTLNTDKMPPGTFSFVINGDGQVPATEGDK